jgi:Zn-dependent membrane protease YugP
MKRDLNLDLSQPLKMLIKHFISIRDSYDFRRERIYNQYALMNTQGRRTGREIVELFISNSNLKTKVQQETSGVKQSSYAPRKNCIYLNSYKYKNSDFQSVAIAAHECGHAWMFLKQNLKFSSLGIGKLTGTLSIPIVLMDSIHVIFNEKYWLLATQLFPLSVVLSIFLQIIGNYCKEENEKEASKIGLTFLHTMGLISVNEFEGIEQILEYSLLSYKKGSFNSWISFSMISLISTIIVGTIFLIRFFLMKS